MAEILGAEVHRVKEEKLNGRFRAVCSCGYVGSWRKTAEEAEYDALTREHKSRKE